MKNVLIVGSKKQTVLDHLPDKFLLIDDGELIEALHFAPRKSATLFNVSQHSFNPLRDLSYRQAREFIDILDAIFPEGDSTLTKRYSNFIILKALLSKPATLHTLITRSKDTADAYQKIQTLLLSPVLRDVLTRPTNISFKGTILARLNRAELGDFDCFVLANLLVSQYRGPVIIPDFGFYAHPAHSTLLRQNRLVAGIHSFEEVPKLRHQLVQVETKIASRCTPDDAEILARYAGVRPGTNGYTDFIDRAIGAA